MKIYELEQVDGDIFYEETVNSGVLFPKLLHDLNITKRLIDKDPYKWNYCKKCINDYEYIYTSSFSKKNICQKKPISRSYFKILEIIKSFNIKGGINVDCIAEAPGGFVEYFNEIGCSINAISLDSSDNSIPHWNRNIITNDNINIFSGADNTGDIYKLLNILHYIKCSGKNTRDIVTGDGGFDYTTDFSKQESDSYPLIYSEILMGLLLLKRGGIFICKIFDIMYLKTIRLLYLLRINFETMYIVKPSMSRNTNSEKYIVCVDYKGYNRAQVNMMLHSFHKELNIKVPKRFISNISDYNNLYVNTQISEIKRGINMKENNLKNYPTSEQISIGEKWCKTHNLILNRTFSRYRSSDKW